VERVLAEAIDGSEPKCAVTVKSPLGGVAPR